MKLISLVAIAFACAMAGQYTAHRLNDRVTILEKILLMFGMVENEINYLNRPTSEIIKTLCEKDELRRLDFLPICLSAFESGENISEAWAQAISRCSCVDGEDVCILYSFGESLGRSDSDGQIASCRYHEQIVSERLAEARERRKRYASLACGLGMLSGIGAFIIFF